jgi:hypothetical protein
MEEYQGIDDKMEEKSLARSLLSRFCVISSKLPEKAMPAEREPF